MEAKTNERANPFPKEGTCCLCGGRYTLYGNNPWPLADGEDKRCCNPCNALKVIPARLRLLASKAQ